MREDQDQREMEVIQRNLDIAIKEQRAAHEALVFASRKTQIWRAKLAILEQQMNSNTVVHRQ